MDEPEITPGKLLIAVTCLLGATFVPYVEATISPLMMLPMTEEFGWTRTQFALASTFFFILGTASVLLFGRIADRYGPRLILLFGSVCGGATMLLLSQQNAELWRLYLAYALLGACGSSGLGYTRIIGSLFSRHRAKALAIFGGESILALGTLPLLTNALNAHLGWRGTYAVYAVLMFALSPVIYLVMRGPGLSTGNRSSPAAIAAVTTTPAPPMPDGMTPAQIRRDRVFWLIVLTAVLGGGFNVGFTAHIIAAITDRGFSSDAAAGVLSAGTLLGLIGAVSVGFALDRSRSARIMSLYGMISALGISLFAVASLTFGGLPLLVTGLAVQRIAMGALPAGTNYLQTRFVGMRSFGEAFAMQVVAQGIAMALTPPLFGLLFEWTGSYTPMYWSVLVAALAGAGVYLMLGPYRFGTAAAQPR
jgi:MFS family permease